MDATAGRPLRVLHLATGGWPRIGGGQLLSTRLAEGLALRGHAVHMVDAAHGRTAWTVPPPDARPAAGPPRTPCVIGGTPVEMRQRSR